MLFSEWIAWMKFSLLDFGVFETRVNLVFFTRSCMGKLSSSIPEKGRNSLVYDMHRANGNCLILDSWGLLFTLLHLIWVHRLHLSHFMAWWLLATALKRISHSKLYYHWRKWKRIKRKSIRFEEKRGGIGEIDSIYIK